MKKLVLATAAVLALLSIAGCGSVGKGKAHRRSSPRAKWLYSWGMGLASRRPSSFWRFRRAQFLWRDLRLSTADPLPQSS